MKYIKLVLISLISLFAIATAISLLLPSTIVVSRAIDINASVDSVQKKLNNVTEWKIWIANRDTLPVEISGSLFKMGETKVFLKSVTPTEIKTDWQVKDGPKMPGTFTIIKHENTSTVTVQWQFVQKLKWYPWEKFASIITDKVLGPFMEQSLDNLKKSVETT
jgi:hypothetical protein